MRNDRDLYESLDVTLWSLGEETRNLVMSALETNRILFRPDNVDITSVDRIFFQLFGTGSGALMISAYKRLDRKRMIGFDDSQIANAVDKIRKWIEIRNKSSATLV